MKLNEKKCTKKEKKRLLGLCSLIAMGMAILGDPGADSGGEGKSKRVEK